MASAAPKGQRWRDNVGRLRHGCHQPFEPTGDPTLTPLP
jgi:hypothetical protein